MISKTLFETEFKQINAMDFGNKVYSNVNIDINTNFYPFNILSPKKISISSVEVQNKVEMLLKNEMIMT